MNRADMLKGASLACGALAVSEGATATPTDAAAPNPAADRSADAALDALLAAEWADYERRHPISASLAGNRAGDDRWDDQSEAALADEAAHQRDVLARMERIGRERLTDGARLNYDLYAGQLRDALRGYELGTQLFAIDQRNGVQTYAQYTGQLRFSDARDYDNWQRRLDAYPRAVAETLALLREAVARRMLWPRVSMQRLPAQLDRLVTDPERSPFYEPLTRIPAGVPAADAARLRERARDTIANRVNPALRELRAFVVERYLPAAPEEAGLAHVPGGDALYAYFARTYTTTDMTPDAIHELGLREVARVRDAMEKLAPQTGYRGPLRDVINEMRGDPANYHTSGHDLLTAYRAIAKRIDPELVKAFKTLPRLPYGVVPIPESLAPDTTTAYYWPGALDGTRAGSYYVNLYQPNQRPIYEMMVLSLHESVPGHHLQIALAQELRGLPEFRRSTLAYTAFVEGWGLYAESLGDELGLYDDPKSRFGALTYEMWRAVRLVVDTGMHARGWSRQRAIDYFLDNAAKTPLDVTNEVDRYITNPGQALAYKIGQLKIRELRERAHARLGARFDLRDFHEVVLEEGALPLDVLERRVAAWLAKT
ncbi:MAG: hypothetical protein QOJ39_1769 [Candidatus Eremiobacteraeota bacterium]|jgi:uncharacterized protein (DUF885 family)|nr:hypothetical protein [Candidatus Eremiobacteraeota bacterium]